MIPTFALLACTTGVDGPPASSDDDRLTDAAEAELGTDAHGNDG